MSIHEIAKELGIKLTSKNKLHRLDSTTLITELLNLVEAAKKDYFITNEDISIICDVDWDDRPEMWLQINIPRNKSKLEEEIKAAEKSLADKKEKAIKEFEILEAKYHKMKNELNIVDSKKL